MHSWLAEQQIKPLQFTVVVGEGGLGFEISFLEEQEADRFVRRFRSFIA
jgi:hypothetical protein